MFNTIEKNVTAEIVEKKSKFIANIYYIETVEEAEELIKQAKKTYFDSRHNCYAFSVMSENGIINRFSDDGEPSGTAGAPMLNILTSQNLCNVLVIVTRYFGGILLGTGGLVRAYSEATQEALKIAKIVQKESGLEVEFVVDYAELEKLKYYLKVNNISVFDIKYEQNANVIVDISKEKYNEILENQPNLNFKILENKIIKPKFIVVN